MTAFSDRLEQFFREFFVLDPLQATAAGLHDHDDRWPDVSAEGRYSRLAFADEWTRRLAGFGAEELSADERIDRDLVLMELDASRFHETKLRQETWDPLLWVYLLGGGIFPLLAREFAPLASRLASVAGRLEGVPAVLAAARAQLVGDHGRPVSRLHTETAIRQLAGIEELIADALAQADGDPSTAAVRPRLEAAAAAARAALADFGRHLEQVVLPASDGEGRLGDALFADKLRHTLKSELTPAEVEARARHDYAAVRAEMIRLARILWPTWVPDRPLPVAPSSSTEDAEATDRTTVRGVLDAIAADHPAAGDILQFCRDELVRIEDFVVDRQLMGLADEPLEIRWTPVFARSFGGAMLDAPGPLDRGQKAFFSVTPIPDDWSAEQAESYLREDNARMRRLLTIHEAVPGHYLQAVYANRTPSLARAIFWSGVFAEGWAVYVTQVMMDVGFGADDPALLLVHWKFYLRTVTNALIDVGIHAGAMTEAEALSLMIDGGFQEESEARTKWTRARLTSTQLSTYFVGSAEMWDLEAEVRRRAAAASSDPRGAAGVPVPRVVGNFGATPGFDYRTHLESVISHGSPPMTLLRRLILGAA
jgi:uncharacterized protein (DUF885 family)